MAPGLIDFINGLLRQVKKHTTAEFDVEYLLEVDVSMLRRLVREMRERYDLFEIANSELDAICVHGGRAPLCLLGRPLVIGENAQVTIVYGDARFSASIDGVRA